MVLGVGMFSESLVFMYVILKNKLLVYYDGCFM